MVQTGHLFAPMPDVIRDDMAFIDRLHFYLPGWEIPKMQQRALHRPLRLRRRLPGRGAARAAQAQLHGDHRPPLLARRPSQRPRPQGGAKDRLRADEDPLSRTARSTQRRARRAPRARARGPAPGEGAAQEDGLVRVLPHLVQLHRPRDGRGAVRRRARAGRPRPDLRRSAAARHRLHRRRHLGRHRGALPGRGLRLRRHRQAQARRRRRRAR